LDLGLMAFQRSLHSPIHSIQSPCRLLGLCAELQIADLAGHTARMSYGVLAKSKQSLSEFAQTARILLGQSE